MVWRVLRVGRSRPRWVVFAPPGRKSGSQLENFKCSQQSAVADKESGFSVCEAAVSACDPCRAGDKDSLLCKTAKGGVGELSACDEMMGGHVLLWFAVVAFDVIKMADA